MRVLGTSPSAELAHAAEGMILNGRKASDVNVVQVTAFPVPEHRAG
jgi:hypothetical protein